MSDSTMPQTDSIDPGDDEMASVLFAQLVMQQSNLAMMLLGKSAHPETGKMVRDVEAAKVFIDMLAMIEAKTKGNLSKEEAGLLKNSLMAVRMAFVESVDAQADQPATAKPSAQADQLAAAGAPNEPASTAAAPGAEEEHKKKFTKKY